MDDEEGPGLSAGRSRRSTAGNRMRELLEQERERLELKRGTEDDEMFKEEEGDVDFEAKVEEAEDIIDSDFDQSSDDGNDDDDELQGEREIEEAERIAKKQSRVKAAPIGVRKVAIATPKPSTSSSGIEVSGRPSKRISFASGSAHGEGSGQQRSSARKSTVNASLSVQARLKLEEKRRQEVSERAVPKRKKVRLSQADRIAEALEMEETNRESLSKYLKLEEERRERDRRQGKKQISGLFMRFRSVAEDRNAQQRKMVQVSQESKQAEAVALTNGAITTDPVFAAREAARKERENQGARLLLELAEKPSASKPEGLNQESKTAEGMADADETTGQQSKITTATDVVMTDKENDRQDVVEGAEAQVQSEVEPEADNGTTIVAETQETIQQIEDRSPSIEVAPEFETRSYVSLHQLSPDTPWQDCWSYILGSHVDWSHYSYVPARNRPLRPRQSVCPITGLAAVYKDPRSGIAYANKEAYDVLTRVMAGTFQWSGKPESQTINSQAYDPLEMGCWLDSIDERGACSVLDKATDKVTPVSYRSRATVAPGDEQAIVAAAQALPAGTTRSGTRRAPESGS